MHLRMKNSGNGMRNPLLTSLSRAFLSCDSGEVEGGVTQGTVGRVCSKALSVALTDPVDFSGHHSLLPALGQHCARIRWKPSEKTDSEKEAVKYGKFTRST